MSIRAKLWAVTIGWFALVGLSWGLDFRRHYDCGAQFNPQHQLVHWCQLSPAGQAGRDAILIVGLSVPFLVFAIITLVRVIRDAPKSARQSPATREAKPEAPNYPKLADRA